MMSMSDDVQFGDENVTSAGSTSTYPLAAREQNSKGPMASFLQKMGLARSDQQAFVILVGVVVVCMSSSAFIFSRFVLGLGTKHTVHYSISPDVKNRLPLAIQQQLGSGERLK